MKCVWEIWKNNSRSRSNRSPHPHPFCGGKQVPHNGFSRTPRVFGLSITFFQMSVRETQKNQSRLGSSRSPHLHPHPSCISAMYQALSVWWWLMRGTFEQISVRFWWYFIFWNTLFLNLMSTIEPTYLNVESEERYLSRSHHQSFYFWEFTGRPSYNQTYLPF